LNWFENISWFVSSQTNLFSSVKEQVGPISFFRRRFFLHKLIHLSSKRTIKPVLYSCFYEMIAVVIFLSKMKERIMQNISRKNIRKTKN